MAGLRGFCSHALQERVHLNEQMQVDTRQRVPELFGLVSEKSTPHSFEIYLLFSLFASGPPLAILKALHSGITAGEDPPGAGDCTWVSHKLPSHCTILQP